MFLLHLFAKYIDIKSGRQFFGDRFFDSYFNICLCAPHSIGLMVASMNAISSSVREYFA